MSSTALKGTPVQTVGNIPKQGTAAPNFNLVGTDLKEKSLSDFKGKRILMNIFPSVDTNVCAQSVRQFYKQLSSVPDLVVLNISKDTPFAFNRFCAAEGIENAIALSAFRSSFGKDYGIEMADGPLKGLLARSVIILNEKGEIIHSEVVPEISQEPDYPRLIQIIETK